MAFVTQSNWKAALVEAKAHIEEAAFVAVDLELSGVQTTPWRAANQVDTLDTRYLNLRDSAHKFGLLQFGLCPFIWDPALSKFVAHPYSFCLFPRDELPIEMPARDFLCQATSLEFLAKHKFNFNACIYDGKVSHLYALRACVSRFDCVAGITYLSREQEKLARVQLAKWRVNDADRPEIALSKTGDVLFCESVRVQVGEWRDRVLQKEKDSHDDQARSCLMVEVSGSYQASLVHQVLRKSFQDLVAVTEEGKKRVKVIFPKSTKERAALLLQWEKDKSEHIEAQLLDGVGFRHLVDAIVESGKPLVGHNCFLDFAHIYSKFFADLPLNCMDFCSSIRQHFRCLLDTKYLLKSVSSIKEILGNRSTTLGSVYSRLEANMNKATVELGSSEMLRYDGKDMKHEAGYDAYMTGVIFVNMCKIVKVDPVSLSSIEATVLGSYANVFYLGWPSEMALDLSCGKEATGTKSVKMNNRCERTVIVWRCCKDDKEDREDVEKSVGSCFSSKTDLEVLSIDEGSAFVVFRKKECLEMFVRAFDGHGVGAGPCDVKGMMDRGFKVVRFEVFERVCRSPLSTLKLADALEVLTANDLASSPSRKKPRL